MRSRLPARAPARPARWAGAFAFATTLSLLGCSLAFDTDYLVEGDGALECASREKLCPVSSDDPEGEQQCVPLDSPETGCARDACSPCQLPGAVARCTSAGECGIAVCSDRNEDCDGNEANGCEIDTAANIDNCGACGRVCQMANAVTACVSGVCQFVICTPPFADCDGSTKNACETDTSDNPQHCGDCETVCAGECIDGACVP
ncbi:MAG TPA: hypothetical protein VLC09_15620 [Polyangiaceae bacterium]|nr:hypothetical protein [Polyangiaceae bacterium]